ncbi:hypothetical protein ACFX2I_025663 [Malus domestica]
MYPYVADKETSFAKFMRDEIKLEPGQDQLTRFKYNLKLCFVRVLLHAYNKEGFLEEGAVICAPLLTDISLWTRLVFAVVINDLIECVCSNVPGPG